jgi:hypothetical protein
MICREQVSRPPCGGGPGWGVAPDLSNGVVSARSQDDEPHVDRLEHAIEVAKDIIIRKAQNVIALRSERARASGVANNLSIGRVRRAIDLDDHPRLEAGEVGNEAAEDNLAAETKARNLLAPEALPQAPLGARRIASEASRESP